VLRSQAIQEIDTVFCFGILDHVAHHVELISLIDRLKPNAIIVDTAISPADGCSMDWIHEVVEDEWNAAPDGYSRNGKGLVGVPTREAVKFLVGHFGYDVSDLDWGPYLQEHPAGHEDYLSNKRASFLAIRVR
jgi:hypothetical protein